jgi:hypothetical protein
VLFEYRNPSLLSMLTGIYRALHLIGYRPPLMIDVGALSRFGGLCLASGAAHYVTFLNGDITPGIYASAAFGMPPRGHACLHAAAPILRWLRLPLPPSHSTDQTTPTSSRPSNPGILSLSSDRHHAKFGATNKYKRRGSRASSQPVPARLHSVTPTLPHKHHAGVSHPCLRPCRGYAGSCVPYTGARARPLSGAHMHVPRWISK